jgi:stearoyl-CoA desaturase (Delta-9 desaturase)
MSPELFAWLQSGLTQASYWQMAIYLLVMMQLTMASTTLYLHRCAAHRGVDFHPVLEHMFRFWSWFTTAMVTKEWVGIHRKHHAKCETVEDPHSPRIYGLGTVLRKGVDLYRIAGKNKEDMDKYGQGTPDDFIERHLYTKRRNWGVSALLFINLALFGVPGIVVWALHMISMPLWAAGVINGIGHWFGYRNFDTADSATNIVPWGVWIGGEELHNNHHAFPSSAKFALRKYEFDIGWFVISIFEKVGLAKVLRVAPTLDVRPNIHVPDTETVKAMMTHRWQVMTDYFNTVLKPQFKQDARDLPRRLRKAFRSDGRWLDVAHREKLQQWITTRPQLAELMEYRARLQAVLELKSAEVDAKLNALREWCKEAEASGIRALEEYSARLKGYQLAHA